MLYKLYTTSPNSYEDTDKAAIAAGEAALGYIMDGSTEGLPLEFRGAKVFGVIGILRENDDALHGPDSTLNEDQIVRLEEIEGDVDASVAKRLQYYPFGHNRDKEYAGDDIDDRMRSGRVSGWGAQARRSTGKRSNHGGKFTL